MPSQDQIKTRELFLTEFVKALINSSLTDEEKAQIKKQAQRNQILLQRINQQTTEFAPTQHETMRHYEEAPMIPSMMHSQKYNPPMPKPHMQFQQKMPAAQEKQSFNLGKLTSVLLDPAVLSIESPGPNKNILVNRSGRIQASNIILSQEEISEIIKEISDKTRVPVSPGVFKAAFQDLIITAVLSEHVGARFIIQKHRIYQG